MHGCPSLETGISASTLPPSQSVLQQLDLSLPIFPISSLSVCQFSFLPFDDLFETSDHGRSRLKTPQQRPLPQSSETKDYWPARPFSHFLLCHSPSATLPVLHTPNLRPLHWLLPQPRIIFLPSSPTMFSLSCLPSPLHIRSPDFPFLKWQLHSTLLHSTSDSPSCLISSFTIFSPH